MAFQFAIKNNPKPTFSFIKASDGSLKRHPASSVKASEAVSAANSKMLTYCDASDDLITLNKVKHLQSSLNKSSDASELKPSSKGKKSKQCQPSPCGARPKHNQQSSSRESSTSKPEVEHSSSKIACSK